MIDASLLSEVVAPLLKLTLFLALSIGLILFLGGKVEPRWRVGLARVSLVALPVVVMAGLMVPLVSVPLWPADPARPVVTEIAQTVPVIMSGDQAEEYRESREISGFSRLKEAVTGKTLAILIWGVVSAWLIVREVSGLWGCLKRARRAPAATSQWGETWEDTCARHGVCRIPELRVIAGSASPALLPGRPGILLMPAKFADEFEDNPHDLEMVFHHEAAHLKHRDRSWLLVARSMRALVWWHPLVWCLCAWHHRLCEEAADACAAREVEGGSPAYQEALARVALRLLPAQVPVPALLRRSEIVDRLRSIPGNAGRRPPGARGLCFASVLSLLAAAILGNTALDRANAAEDGQERRKAEFLKQVADQWEPEVMDYEPGEVSDKLRKIVVPETDFRETPLKEAVAHLAAQSVKLDTTEKVLEKKGVKIRIADTVDGDIPITMRLGNAPLVEVLRYVAALASAEIEVDQKGVLVKKARDQQATELYVVTYQISEKEYVTWLGDSADAKSMLEKADISFDAEGSSAEWAPLARGIVVRHSSEVHEQIENWLQRQRQSSGSDQAASDQVLPPGSDADLVNMLQAATLPEVLINNFRVTAAARRVLDLTERHGDLSPDEADRIRKLAISWPGGNKEPLVSIREKGPITALRALQLVAEKAEFSVSFPEGRVSLTSLKEVKVGTFAHQIPWNLFVKMRGEAADAKAMLEAAGFSFAQPPSAAIYDRKTETLIFRNTDEMNKRFETWLDQQSERLLGQ